MTSLSSNHNPSRYSQMKVSWKHIDNSEKRMSTRCTNGLDMECKMAEPQINKKLDFDETDGYDEDDEEDQSGSHDIVSAKSKKSSGRGSDGVIRKRIDFGSSEDEVQNQDRDPSPIRNVDFGSDSEVDSENSYHSKKQIAVTSILKSRGASPPGAISGTYKNTAFEPCHCSRRSYQAMPSGDHLPIPSMVNQSHEYEIIPSPHRTRSGRIYTSGDCRSSALNMFCSSCKPNTPLSIDNHFSSPSHPSCQTQPSIKRPFGGDSPPLYDDNIENVSHSLCSGDKLRLNLLQSDIIDRKVAAKRSRRYSSGMSDYWNADENNDGKTIENNSEPPLTLPFQEQPHFELPPPTLDAPPPLDYIKRPVSRLSLIREKQQNRKGEQFKLRTDLNPYEKELIEPECPPLNRFRTPSFESQLIATPGYICQTPTNLHSPPINEVRAMRIFDSHSPKAHRAFASAVTAPKHRIAFEGLEGVGRETKVIGHQRRKSAPAGGVNSGEIIITPNEDYAAHSEQSRKLRKRIANINPFTPTPTLDSIKRRKASDGSSM